MSSMGCTALHLLPFCAAQRIQILLPLMSLCICVYGRIYHEYIVPPYPGAPHSLDKQLEAKYVCGLIPPLVGNCVMSLTLALPSPWNSSYPTVSMLYSSKTLHLLPFCGAQHIQILPLMSLHIHHEWAGPLHLLPSP